MTDHREPLGHATQGEAQRWVADEYYELNGTHYDILDELPTPLEFSRLVHISRPVLIKASEMPGVISLWTDEYLTRRMGDREISIAVTPTGRADAITRNRGGRLYFTEPHVDKMTIGSFLDKITLDPADATSADREVYYLQSQNGNMFTGRYFDSTSDPDSSEFEPLREDVPSEITWCSEALDRCPDAVNLWIGNSASVTSVHSDPYENIYSVVRGAKHFTLFPPTEGWCLQERSYPHARYVRSEATSRLEHIPSPPTTPEVRWSSVLDPTDSTSLPPEAHPIHITVGAGETLYLPAGWWHYVRQSEVTIAVNHWYDMESRGASWVWLNLLRGVGDPPPGNGYVEQTSHVTEGSSRCNCT
ncbi:Clavaminate synthase-like protein [Fomitopsis serialis]|uniref:Clavaminate synthase-like protein n=1 Tax=Fomitopsis serialis TaxID=139415 RepID=UPI0020072815|nr:Clavaminate synthase-like protein [Neoantrodia serialis]KAH9938630.1 Clavaminate synthase-like protein [Neoantrodia serialis]